MQKEPVRDDAGNPIITKTDSSNPWWGLLEDAVHKAGGKLQKPEIFPASTDARYFRRQGFPAIGFSPMTNTPILLHDHNEVTVIPHIVFNNLLAYSYKETIFSRETSFVSISIKNLSLRKMRERI